MVSNYTKQVANALQKNIKQNGISSAPLFDFLDVAGNAFNEEPDSKWALSVTKYIKECCLWGIRNRVDMVEMDDLYWKTLKIEAPHLFESYLLYLERKRQKKDKFYEPKMKQFKKHGLIQAVQDLEDDKLDMLSISMCPGSGKTTFEKFFATWIIGRHPDDYSLFFSHSNDITRMFYDGILDITSNDDEYCFGEIFPDVRMTSTDAKRECINFNKYKPFANIQCTSVGSKNAGKVRCNRYLYCDDLIGGIEEALNKNILDKLWRIYGTDARQRKLNEQVKEIHIATRWSVHDVIGRLQELYGDSDRARFIAVPDIDPITGESNFDYEYNGMSVQFFHDQELAMDDISYRCLYKNEPIEREGILYHPDELQRYINGLPESEPDAILAVCDTKDTGTDFNCLPVFYQYGDKFYLEDVVYKNIDPGTLDELNSDMLVKHHVQQCQFESNKEGSRTAAKVAELVKTKGGICHITKKYTTTNKETKIIVNSSWVKEHVIFKDSTEYTPKSDYGQMMSALCSYTQMGKNATDDVPDAMAMFALFADSLNKCKVTITSRAAIGF